ncbi:MAG: shikimate kinase [Firmicutes bacterium HGW-Firmicutes-21]|nr:MAG: shikimate kinase [Firmicutes bacterium HGW-Firmicutes-21]
MKRFGLLGGVLSHSFSPQIHSVYGDYEYKMFLLAPEALEPFFKKKDFDGINVTIPYKQAVIPYVTSLSPIARRLNSVNTITVAPNGNIYGDNTDYRGFSYMLKKAKISVTGKKVVVLGSGGSSRTVYAVCEDEGAAEVIIVSRGGSINYDNLNTQSDAEIIINTTPVGMYPNNGRSPVKLDMFSKCEAVADLIYNPLKSALILQAEKLRLNYINGMSMLAAQAKYSSELFTGIPLEDELIERAVDTVNGIMQNIVLIGMPGCGKSSIGRVLAKRLGKAFLDSDTMVYNKTGKSAAEIIRSDGERAFREEERLAAQNAGKTTGSVIATGGGIVLDERNIDALKQNGIIVYIDRNIELLETADRPLSSGVEALKKLYDLRNPLYKKHSDFIINGNGSISETADLILLK